MSLPDIGTGCPISTSGVWLLKTSIIGRNYLTGWEGQFSISVRRLTCLGPTTQSPRKTNSAASLTTLNITITLCPTFLTEGGSGTFNENTEWWTADALCWICRNYVFCTSPKPVGVYCNRDNPSVFYCSTPTCQGKISGSPSVQEKGTQRK